MWTSEPEIMLPETENKVESSMLTIKAPIRLQCKTSFALSGGGFCERLRGNYGLIRADITGEDLLHLVTAPPEVYLAEGGNTAVWNENNVQIRQENILETMNQFLNRILIFGEKNFTYQDSVYVTGIFKKLGIHDIQNFMHQVSRIKEETGNIFRRLELYQESLTKPQQTVKNYREEKSELTQLTEEESLRSEMPLYLHQSILNRLQTGTVYRILQNFLEENIFAPDFVTEEEMRLSEQKRTVRNILLNRMESAQAGKEIPLRFFHENYYETSELSGRQTEKDVTEHITSAVLLQVVDNLFQTKPVRLSEGTGGWLHMEHALYQSAENTLYRLQKRMEARYMESRKTDIHMAQLSQAVWQNAQEVIQQLRPDGNHNGINMENRFPDRNPEGSEKVIYKKLREIRETEKVPPAEMKAADGVPETVQPAAETVMYQNTEENTELFPEQLYQVPNSSLEIQNQYRETLQKLLEVREGKKPPKTEAQTVYETPESIQPAAETVMYQNTEENTEFFLEQLHQIERNNTEIRNRYREALQKLQAAGKGTSKLSPMERMRRDSLKALGSPEELSVSYREEAAQEEENREKAGQILLEMLPLETRRIFKALEQYRKTPKGQYTGQVREGNWNMLMRDIRETERERTRTELFHTRLENRVQKHSGNLPELLRKHAGATGEGDGNRKKTDRTMPLIGRYGKESGLNQKIPYTGRNREDNRNKPMPDTQETERESPYIRLLHTRLENRAWEHSEHLLEYLRKHAGTKRFGEKNENEGRNEDRIGNRNKDRREEGRAMPLIYKQGQGSGLDEEIIQELLEQNRLFRNTSRVKQETVENVKTVQKTSQVNVTQELDTQIKNLIRKTGQDMEDRLDDISDKVYHRLEMRLQNERRRRGY